MMTGHLRSTAGAMVAAALVAVLCSCSAFNVTSIPQPGKSYSDGYDIMLQFENVLNLPDRAKVVMGGTEVGTVTKVDVADRFVTVTARISGDVAVPSNVRAALEQATILGDIYLSLNPPPLEQPATSSLDPGATVALAQTTSPPQLEDTLAHLADFVSSGSIQRLQNTIIGINRVVPAPPALRGISTTVTSDLRGLADNIDVVDTLLAGVSDTAAVLNDRLPSAEYWFSERGMRGFDRAFQVSNYLGRLFPSVGSVYTGGFWIVPLLKSLAEATSAMQRSKWAVEDEWPAWQQLFTGLFLPQDKNPAINIVSIAGPDGRELSGNVANVLRILGAAP